MRRVAHRLADAVSGCLVEAEGDDERLSDHPGLSRSGVTVLVLCIAGAGSLGLTPAGPAAESVHVVVSVVLQRG